MFLDTQNLEAEVTQLESRLQDARAQLAASEYPSPPSSLPNSYTIIKGELQKAQQIPKT
jgi:urease accessory protein